LETEAEILQLRLNEDIVFSPTANRYRDRAVEAQVPASIIEFYSLSSEDHNWVDNHVEELIDKERWVLGNASTVIWRVSQNFYSPHDYFEQKFPRFDEVVEKFTRTEPTSRISQLLLGSNHYYVSFYPRSLVEKRDEFIKELTQALRKSCNDKVYERSRKAYGASPEDWKRAAQNKWQPLGPMPIVPPDGLSPKEAEIHVSQILKFYGLEGVQKTRYSRDGGIDVESNTAVFQVKHQVAPVGVQVVREIYGVASAIGKRAGIFAKIGFTKEAKSFAEKNGIALFRYIPSVQGLTPLSKSLEETGFASFK
jgi:hypothetical protein